MEPTTAQRTHSRDASPESSTHRNWRQHAAFVTTFLAAWFGLELTVTSPPVFASAVAALLAAGGVLLLSATLTSRDTPREVARRIGLGRPNVRGLLAATIVGSSVFATYVVGAALLGIDLEVRANWPTVFLGVLLFHGLAEELVWRGYAFGYLRRRHRFWAAIAWSVPLIALTHVPIIAGNGVAIGAVAVLTAAVTCLPFAYLWERSGRTVWAPAILHGLQGEGMRHDLGRFLPIARRSPTNYILVVALMIAPIVTLFALWDSAVDAPFVLTAAGATLTLTGAFAISRFAAEPNYDVILADDTPSNPRRWATARHRYFLLNWVRAGFTWAALACFVSAAYLHWT